MPEPSFSREKLDEILSKHVEWLALDGGNPNSPIGERADLQGCNLSGQELERNYLVRANLSAAHLDRANLTFCNLKTADLEFASLNGTDLLFANLEGAILWYAHLEGAHLLRAHLKEAKLVFAHIEEANLKGTHLEGADLTDAHLGGVDLRRAHFDGAKLSRAHLERANLRYIHLEEAELKEVSLKSANLYNANLKGANLFGANFEKVNVTGVAYDRKGYYRGIRVETCYGSPMFKRHAQDMDFLEELKERESHYHWGSWAWGNRLYWLWFYSADCGRTPWKWMAWSIGFACFFAALYTSPDWFLPYLDGLLPAGWCQQIQWHWPQFEQTATTYNGEPLNFLSARYFSIVTFTTLGFGDVVAANATARFLVASEVILGYIMLGGLISIFATLVARRS